MTDQANPAAEHRYESAYMMAFVLTMLLVWSPFKALAYMVPVLAIGCLLVVTRDRALMRRGMLWLGAWMVVILTYRAIATDFVLSSAVLAVITYGTFGFVLCVPTARLANRQLLRKMTKWAVIVLLIQTSLGFSQAIYGVTQTGSLDLANGDYVEGTIHPGLAPEGAFANPMFAVNVSFFLLSILPLVIVQRKHRFLFFWSLAVLVLASVLHVIIFLALAGAAAVLFYKPPLRVIGARSVVVSSAVLTIALAGLLLSSNLGTLPYYLQELIFGQSPRAIVTWRASVEMPQDYPYLMWIGLGPGQFSSRAALIGSGSYFGGPLDPKPVPFFPVGTSEAFQTYLEELWISAAADPFAGSTTKPFFSWLSVYTEFGAPALLAVFVLSVALMVRVKARTIVPVDRWYAVAFGSGVVFLVLLGSQENYWEVPQAIFAGAMFLKVMYANLVMRTPVTALELRSSLSPASPK